jgi:hypothetical protein
LPIINAPIPITGFYVVGATLLAAIYCYFHFYLQPMWRALATLPAVFRDGVTQDDKTDPWVLTNLVRTEFAQLSATAPPLTRLENRLSIVMAWWLVPVTLVALWARYLPAHDIGGLTWLAFLIAATTFFGRYTFGLARAKLRGEEPLAGSAPPGDPPQTLVSRVLRELSRVRSGQIIIWFLLPFLIIVALSISASVQSPRDSQGSVAVVSLNEQVLREFAPTPAKLLTSSGSGPTPTCARPRSRRCLRTGPARIGARSSGSSCVPGIWPSRTPRAHSSPMPTCAARP